MPGLVPLVVFAQGLTGRMVLGPGDGLQYYLPLHVLAGRAWRAGGLPSWNPGSFGGSPLLATGQAAVFYPVNLLFAVLSPVAANNASVVASYVIAGLGAWALVRHLTGDAAAGAVSGVAFALCGFMVGHLGHQSIIASAAWLPWVLWAVDRLADRPGPDRPTLGPVDTVRLAQAAVVVALAFLAGHSQTFAATMAFAGLYALALVLGDRARRGLRPLVALAGAAVLGAGLAAVQLVPTLAVLSHTDRATALAYAEATSFSLPRSHGVLALFPYAFGGGRWPYSAPYGGAWNLTELAGYCGLAALVLAAVGLATTWRADRRVLALVAVAGAATLAALGDATPLGRVVYEVPVFGQFRAWARYLLGVDLVVAVLAGYGVAALRRPAAPAAAGAVAAGDGPPADRVEPALERRTHRTAVRAALAAGGVVVVLAAALPVLPTVGSLLAGGRTGVAARVVPAAFALGAVALVVGWRRPRLRSVGVAAAVALVGLDALVSYGWWYEWRHPVVSREEVAALVAGTDPPGGQVPDAPGGIERWAFVGADVRWALPWFPPLSDLSGRRSVNGYDPLAPSDYMEAAGAMAYNGAVGDAEALVDEGSSVLDLLRVTRVVIHPEAGAGAVVDEATAAAQEVPGWALRTWTRQPALPEAFVVGATRTAGRAEVLATLWGRGRSFAPAAEALLEEACATCPGPGAPGVAGEVLGPLRWGRSSVHAEVAVDRPGLLVLSQAWFPGWHAEVDGRSVPVVRVDALVQGVAVQPGDHRVVLRYRPPGLTAGLALSLVTALGLAGAAVAGRRRHPAPTGACSTPEDPAP